MALTTLLIATSVAAFAGVMPRKGLQYELSEASHQRKQRHARRLQLDPEQLKPKTLGGIISD